MSTLQIETDRSDSKTADGMFIIDSDQTIVAWNSTAERIFGITKSDAIGKKCYDVLPTDDSSGRSTCKQDCFVIKNAHRSRLTRDFDVNVKDKDGQEKILNMSILLPPSRGGNKEVIHLFRDVTGRRAIETVEREIANAAVPNALTIIRPVDGNATCVSTSTTK